MRADDIRQLLRRQPFVPLRFHVTDGRTFDVYHPDMVLVLQSRLDIGVAADPVNGVPDRSEFIALLHVVRIEELPRAASVAS